MKSQKLNRYHPVSGEIVSMEDASALYNCHVELYQKILNSTADRIVDDITSVIASMGFTDFVFGRLSEKALSSGKILTSRAGLLALYRQERFFLHDIVLQHAKNTTQPIFLSTVERYLKSAPFDAELVSRNLRTMAFYNRHGYSDLYYIPFDIDKGGKKRLVFSVASRDEKPANFQNKVKQATPALQLLVEFIGFVCSTRFPDILFSGKTAQDILITPKPLRLLEVLAKQNVTLKDAAAKLCITLNTANKHIAAVKHALGANTQGAAVYRAIKEGIISS